MVMVFFLIRKFSISDNFQGFQLSRTFNKKINNIINMIVNPPLAFLKILKSHSDRNSVRVSLCTYKYGCLVDVVLVSNNWVEFDNCLPQCIENSFPTYLRTN